MLIRSYAPPPPVGHVRAPLWVLLGAFLLFFLRFGYNYGVSDQDELVPYVLHLLDPSLFTHDWFVQTQATGFNVRTGVALLLWVLALAMPVWLAVLLAYVTAWFAIGGAVYRLGLYVTGSAVASALAVVVALVLTPRWTLGGNDLVHGLFVPSMAGWALALWGLVAYCERRRWLAPVLLGLAVWMQALVGLQVMAVCAALALLASGPWRVRLWRALRLVVVAGAVAAPAVVALAVQQAEAAPEAGAAVSTIMAEVRNPHHYLPSAFPLRSWLLFGVLLASGAGAFAWLQRRGADYPARFVWSLLGTVVAVGGLAALLIEGLDALWIARLQPFKLTVLAKVVLVIGVCWGLRLALPPVFARLLGGHLTAPRRADLLSIGLAVLVLALAVPTGTPLRPLVPPLHPADDSITPVARWAQQRTPAYSVFAVPPSVDGFRTWSERGIVVNFKAFPYNPPDIAEWDRRLASLAPLADDAPGGGARLQPLDRAFEGVPEETWHALAERYGIDYLVRRTPMEDSAALLVYSEGPWFVYALNASALSSAM